MKKSLLILIFLSSSLFAGYSGEIYTYGYFDFVRDNLLALSGVIAGGNDVLYKMAMALAFFIWGLKNITNPKAASLMGFEFAKFLITVTLIQQMFLSAPDDDAHAYVIVDKISTQTAEVRQIPKGIGEMLSLFTSLEDAIMRLMETHYSTPDSISYRNAGLGFSMTAPMEIFQQTVLETNLRKTFVEYYENCKMLGDFSDGTQSMQSITSSKDLFNDLATEQTLFSVIYNDANPDGFATECKTVWTDIKDRVNDSLTAQLTALAKARGTTYANYVSKAKVATQTIIGSSVEAQDQLQEAILRNMTLESVQVTAASLGIGQNQLAKNKSIAEMSMVNDAIFSNLEAQGMIPIMKAVVLSFVIAISWILAILTIATMNMSYLKFIITLNVWLMLWGPLFTVLNYAMDLMVVDALSAYSGGIDMGNQMGIYTILGSKLALLSKMVWSIPMLAFAIAKGSDQAMVSFVSGMGASIASGGQLATRAEQQGAQGGKIAYTDIREQFTISAGADGKSIETNYTGVNGGVNSIKETESMSGTKVEASGNGGTVTTTSDTNGGGMALSMAATVNAQKTQSIAQARESAISNAKSVVEGTGVTDAAAIQTVVNASESRKNGDSNSKMNNVSAQNAESVGNTVSKGYSHATDATKGKSFEATIQNGENQGEKVTFKTGADGKITAKAGIDFLGNGGGFSGSAGMAVSFDKNGDISIKSQDGTTQSLKTSEGFKKDFQANVQHGITETLTSDKSAAQSWTAAHDKMVGTSVADSKTHQSQISSAFEQRDQTSDSYKNSLALNSSISQNQLPSMFQNELANNQDMRNSYLDESGNFKDSTAQSDYTKYVMSRLNSWSQGGQSALSDFADFAQTNGAGNVNGSVNSNGLNTGVSDTVATALNNSSDLVNGVTQNQVDSTISQNKEQYGDAVLNNNDRYNNTTSPQTLSPDTKQVIEGMDGKSLMNDVNSNIGSITSTVDKKGDALDSPHTLIHTFNDAGGSAMDFVKNELKHNYGPSGGSGNTPATSVLKHTF